nr:site-specific DNA-methyltransferase [uncultured Pedobacter sp.]
MNEILDLRSIDITSLNIEKIASLFPNCITETDEGKKIDFDLLKQELSTDIVEGNKERYRLEWPGKREAIVTANIPTTKTLRPVREDSVNFDTTENIYIEGDNLEILKLMQESYLGKIKMIYIDPPYNTGNDFIYNDNFVKTTEEELFVSGQKDEYNQRLVANPETNGRYHSDWLSMMYPRLKLARNLLTEDGVIFISIDDNEVHNLRKICDEVFGEGNFVANILWQKKTSPDARMNISSAHDHILVYSKTFDFNFNYLPFDESRKNSFSNPDNDPRGDWASVDLTGQTGRAPKSQFYTITTPSGIEMPPPEGRCWALAERTFYQLQEDNRIWFGKDGSNRPRLKKFLSEAQGVRPWTWWDNKSVGHSQEGAQELKELFENQAIFDNPKPTKLLQRIISLSTRNSNNDIVLDFFSGSASFANAVLLENSIDLGNRRFILVQLPEDLSEGSNDFKANSSALKAGYKNICEIGRERIRRASKKIKAETNAAIDYGFRVFKLDSSNMQDVYYKPQDYNQATLDLFADNVKDDRTGEDLVTQVMLDWGLPLSLKMERKTLVGKEVYTVSGDSLYCCFDKDIDEAFAKEVAKEKPLRVVFRDKSFKDDTAKENVKQLLKQLSKDTEMKVI